MYVEIYIFFSKYHILYIQPKKLSKKIYKYSKYMRLTSFYNYNKKNKM